MDVVPFLIQWMYKVPPCIVSLAACVAWAMIAPSTLMEGFVKKGRKCGEQVHSGGNGPVN